MKKIWLWLLIASIGINALAAINAEIETSLGKITVELDDERAPITVQNFIEYAKSGHYNGTIFHRVIKDFMIQGGGFTPNMAEKATREPIKNEATNKLKNLKYTLAMARTRVVDSATAQFFINVKNNPNLDHRNSSTSGFGYAVFGKVIDGFNVVDSIATVPTQKFLMYSDVPVEPVVIKSVRILRNLKKTLPQNEINNAVQRLKMDGNEAVVFSPNVEPGIFTTIMGRGSCRQFDPTRQVSYAEEERILRAAMAAPTAMDRRPWEFIVVRNREKLAALAARLPNCRVGNGAQMAIVVCGNLDNGLPGRGKETWIHDCSAASMNILLAAHGLGLGAVWTGVYPNEEQVAAVREILSIPEGFAPLNIIPIGYPAVSVMPKDKWAPEKIHQNLW